MKYLTTIFLAVSLLFVGAFSQTTVRSRDPSWDDAKQLNCEVGYNRVGNYCVKCPTTEGTFFDPATNQCRTCPKGTTFDSVNKKCNCCPDVQVFDTVNQKCNCPPHLPLWNGRKCVKCPEGTQFDQNQNQCYHCPQGFIRDTSSHACKPGL